MPQNRVTDTITHVTLNTINSEELCFGLPQKYEFHSVVDKCNKSHAINFVAFLIY